MKKPWLKVFRGFTLIEMLVSIVIIAIVIVPVMMVLVRGTYSSSMISKREKALFVAQGEMEKVLSKKGVILRDTLYSKQEGNTLVYVKRKTENNEGLTTIFIEVYQDTTDSPLAKLRSLKLEM